MENKEFSVKNMLNDKIYKLIDLPVIEFAYGDIEFFDKDSIDEAQEGFRYNPETEEKIEDWTGDEYVIIGYDSTSGCGPDPYIINTSESKLPVYYLMTDGGDWDNPDLISESLEKFNKAINVLSDYADCFADEELTEDIKDEILGKISKIVGKELTENYWNELLDRAMPFEE